MPYGSVSGLSAYWDARGYSVAGIDDARRAQLLAIASVFVDGLSWKMSGADIPVSKFPGQPATADQELQWPRADAVDAYGNEIAINAVPGAVERATYEAAFYEAANKGALNAAVRADQRVVKEKFDVIEFTYSEAQIGGSGIAGSSPVIPSVLTILAPVLNGGANSYGITGVVA